MEQNILMFLGIIIGITGFFLVIGAIVGYYFFTKDTEEDEEYEHESGYSEGETK